MNVVDHGVTEARRVTEGKTAVSLRVSVTLCYFNKGVINGGFLPIPARLNDIGTAVVDACYAVHSTLGPGLLESVYSLCLTEEIRSRALRVQSQQPVPVVYKGMRLEGGFRIDLLVEGEVIIELKAVDVMHPVFEAQLLTYMKLSGRRLGYLVNFNVPLIRNGIKRMVL